MDPFLQDLIKQEIRKALQEQTKTSDFNSQYGNPTVPYHTHNGIDSPLVEGAAGSSTTYYIGAFNSSGTAASLFPTGWSSSRTSVGLYVVTHNLGNTDYVVCPTMDDGSVRWYTVAYSTNTFTLRTFDSGASLADADVHFAVLT